MKNYLKKHKKVFFWAAGATLAAFFLVWLSRRDLGFAQWYATAVFPIFPSTIGRLMSPIPFSVYEFVLSILILGGVGLLIAIAFLLVRRPETGKRLASGLFLTLLTAVPAVLLMLSLTTSINYGRDTFAEAAGYELRDSAVEELESLCYELVDQINEVSGQIPTDQMGCLTLRDYPLHQKTKAAMQNLGTEHPTLSGYYPNPKPVTFSRGMSHLRLTGMYSPFTVEANYNAHCPDYEIAYTICHELAHLKGWIREDEAGFIAYLACRQSGEPELVYSGCMNGLSYAMNALYRAGGRDCYNAVYGSLSETAKTDFRVSSAYWRNFETKVAEVSNAVNDGYLKANAQQDGVQSYGRMVDLMLAERRSR